MPPKNTTLSTTGQPAPATEANVVDVRAMRTAKERASRSRTPPAPSKHATPTKP